MIAQNAHKRIYGIDILRAAAILFVMQSHALKYLVPYFNVHYYWLFILDGVDVFFVLSGFLIGGILFRMINTGSGMSFAQLKVFWIRRWFRTIPNYLLVLLLLLFAYRITFHEFPDKALHFFTFTQCFASPHPHFFSEAWSLAVEEWFYLFIPLGLFLLLIRAKENKPQAIFRFIILCIAGITLFRVFKVYNQSQLPGFNWDLSIRKQVLTRLDAILYGVAGAYVYVYCPSAWLKKKNSLFIAGLLLCFGARFAGAYNLLFYQYAYLSATALGVLCTLPKLSSVTTGRGLVYKAITFISIISYAMYLLNYTIVSKIILPVVFKMAHIDVEAGLLQGAISWGLFFIVTIALSYLLYRYYEKPATQLRERFATPKKKIVS